MRGPVPVVSALLAVALAACGRSGEAGQDIPRSRAPVPAPEIARVEAGLRPAVTLAGQPAPTRTLAAEMARLDVPGISVAVIHDGRLAWAKGYGATTPGAAPVTPETPFQAGSISKSVSAVGALRLAKSAGLALDADIDHSLRGWRLPRNAFTSQHPVTLRGLLSHTAGINVHGFPGYAATDPLPTLRQVLDGVPPANTEAIRVVAAPGTQWRYSGGGYAIVQQLVEDVSGTPFADWMHGHVLQPVGMRHSSFVQQAPADAAQPHAVDGRAIAGGAHRYPAAAAAGLWSTPSDLARLLMAIQHAEAGRAGPLDVDATHAMLVEAEPGHTMGFDLGGTPGARYFSKGGDTEGFAAFMAAYADRGDGAVVMTNGARGRELADAVLRSIADAYGWPDFRPHVRRAIPLDATALARLPGRYDYGQGKTFTIARDQAGGLTIASPGEPAEPLHAAAADRLFVLSQEADFVFDPGGDAAARSGHIEVGSNALPFRRRGK